MLMRKILLVCVLLPLVLSMFLVIPVRGAVRLVSYAMYRTRPAAVWTADPPPNSTTRFTQVDEAAYLWIRCQIDTDTTVTVQWIRPEGIVYQTDTRYLTFSQGKDWVVNPSNLKLQIGGMDAARYLGEWVAKVSASDSQGVYELFKQSFTIEAAVQTTTTSALKPGQLLNLTMKFDHATIYYSQGNEERAADMGKAFEYGYTILQKDFPKPSQRFKLYIYLSYDDLLQGLVTYGGFPPSSLDFYRKTGAVPRPVNYVMHVPPFFSWRHVAHELTHTFIEEYSGRAFLKIKWLDEGLAEYESWRCLLENSAHINEADSFKKQALSIVNQLKGRNALYPLSNLATENEWASWMQAGKSGDIYSQSYLVVSYVASVYGMDKITSLLTKVNAGATASDAVKAVIGKTQEELLEQFKNASESQIFGLQTTIVAVSTPTIPTVTVTKESSTGTGVEPTSINSMYLIVAAIVIAAILAAVLSHQRKQRPKQGATR